MTALAPLLLLGGVVFVEQPIDGVEPAYTPRFSATIRSRTRYADLDGDGANDIVTKTTAAFQRNGQFPKAQQTPLPRPNGLALADLWDNGIYVLTRDRIEVLRWSNAEWQRTLSQPIEWGQPVIDASFTSEPSNDGGSYLLEDFLVDIDGDSTPEIVQPASDGVHVFAKGGLFYDESAIWRILPRPVAYVPPQTLWPKSARHLDIPNLTVMCDIEINASGVRVFYEDRTEAARRLREDFYAFDRVARGLELPPSASSTVQSNAVDSLCQRVRLNDDSVMDLMKSSRVGETAPPLSVPVVETSVSTDAGASFFSFRSVGSNYWRMVTDYNQDGRIDLISENKQLVEGGIRETLVRGLTGREVSLDVQVWLQGDAGVYPAKPSFSHTFSIELDRPPVYRSAMFLNFLNGDVFSLDGDFDGDGTHDAAIHDRPSRIVIRKGGPKGISNQTIATLAVNASDGFSVVDVDGDGRSDLLVSSMRGEGQSVTEETTVYLSREQAP